jgi:hypothetical protein
MKKNMTKIAALFAGTAIVGSAMALSPYSQNFETLVGTNPTALGTDGWLVGANVFSPGGSYLYGYFAFPAPNGTGAFSAIAGGQGGPNQGSQYLNVFSDYNNTGAQTAGEIVEGYVFREQPIVAADHGKTYKFKFDYRAADFPNGPSGATTTAAFIKVLDPNNGYVTIVNPALDTTLASNSVWSNDNELSVTIGSNWAGYILQIGFVSRATSFAPSGVYYDNVSFAEVANATITGTLSLQNTAGNGGTESIGYTATSGSNSFSGTVTVSDTGSSAYTISVPSGTPAGSYSIKFKGGTFLSKTVNVIWTGTAIAGPAVSLKNGDIDQDTEVGPGDFEAVVAQFGNSGDADCDNDGEVGPSDFEIVVGNFGLGDE